ncbi:hypothetical protein [Salinimicrobium oceani]|uniref:Uncharacterized protein n=1 Tax=Salinimicrobium oceani TaxID=2722702 RepID=A0ABX1CVY8_9FLAO|nr:hypothetical protein [Salinimicrobium oceani]NJW52460.1 hypothetical protein [Salinimicrobium oceani]
MGLFLLLFSVYSCDIRDKECDGICTEEYRTIVVKIVDTEGDPVALDDFQVFIAGTNREITITPDAQTFALMQQHGSYPLFSDKFVPEFAQQQLDLVFTGILDGQEIVSEAYKVGADCCHVFLVSGNVGLQVDLPDSTE